MCNVCHIQTKINWINLEIVKKPKAQANDIINQYSIFLSS